MRKTCLLAALALAACAAPVPRTESPPPAELPLAAYRAALGSQAVYRVGSENSRADIIVRRAGKLQRFGHDHVITARNIDGFVLVSETGGSRADLRVDLRELEVDEAAAREVYGLDTQPSESDIAGTATNMTEKVLETGAWPYADIAINVRDIEGESAHCDVTLTLKGSSDTFQADVLLDYDGDHLSAQGVFALRQTDYGIEPFSLLGGALSVGDRLVVHFRIGADRVDEIIP